MKIAGLDIRWSDPQPRLEKRSHEELTDIGMAFTAAQLAAVAGNDYALPAVYRSVQLLSDITGSLPMQAIDRFGIAEPTTPEVLERPNPTEIYRITIAKIMASLLFRGNAYLWVRQREAGTGNIRSVYVLNPDEVTVVWDRARLFPVYAWRDQHMELGRDIFHIPLNLYPGHLKGVGPIEAARSMMSGLHAEANMSRRLFEDEATPTGLINVPRALSKPEATEVQEMWEESHGGRKRPAVLSGGATFEPITINPVDAQFIEQRNFSVQEVGRLFGIDGFFLLVESGGSLTYSTTETLFRMFLTMTLGPTYLELIEQTFTLMLPSGSRARFNTDEILRADQEARYRSYEIGLSNGFLTIDEVRQMERLARLERNARTPITEEVNNA